MRFGETYSLNKSHVYIRSRGEGQERGSPRVVHAYIPALRREIVSGGSGGNQFGIAVAVEISHHDGVNVVDFRLSNPDSVVHAEGVGGCHGCAVAPSPTPSASGSQGDVQSHRSSLLATLRLFAGDEIVGRRHRVTQGSRGLARSERE